MESNNKGRRMSKEMSGVQRLISKFNKHSSSSNSRKENEISSCSYSSVDHHGDHDDVAFPLNGISLRWFIALVENDEMNKWMRGLNTAEVVKKILRTRDESVGEMLERTEQSLFVKEIADVFVSGSWNCLACDVVNALKTLLVDDKDVFIWMDELVLNQNRKYELNSKNNNELWTNKYHELINKIGHTVVILSPWDKPHNLSRCWCLWDICGSFLNKNTKVDVVIVPSQREAFRQGLHEDIPELVSRIGRIDVRRAKAWNKSDQRMILNVLKSQNGIEAIKERVIAPIHKWMTSEAMALIDELELKGEDDVHLNNLANMCNQVGLMLSEQGLYNLEDEFSRKSIGLYKRLHGEEHPNVAVVLSNRARMFQDQGKFEFAEPLIQEAIEIWKKAENPDLATGFGSLAELFRAQGKYDQAEPLLREALSIRRKAIGDDHPDVANASCLLASLLQDQGKYEEAESLLHQANGIWERKFGSDHVEIATGLNYLASLLQRQGKFDQAEPLYRKSLSIYKKTLGNDHAFVATGLNNLAFLFESQGKYNESEELLREVSVIDKKTLGEEHPTRALHLGNLARVLQGLGRLVEAEDVIREALAIQKKGLGDNHPHVAIRMIYLASILKDAGKLDEADSMCEQAIQIGKIPFSGLHPRMAFFLRVEAEIDILKNRLDEAESNSRKSLEMFKTINHSTPDHPDVAESLLVFVRVLHAKNEDASNLMRTGIDCLEMFDRTLGPRHPRTIKARLYLKDFISN